MLHNRFPVTRLKTVLVRAPDWQPYPTILQRRPWNQLAPAARTLVVKKARAELAQTCPALPATLYLEFHRTGNRSHFQAPYLARRSRLTSLVLGECVENKGRFLDAILDTIWALCEESTWSLPAHIGVQKAGRGLPDVTEPTVDLFAGETASLLAWTLYLLEPRLGALSPLVAPRIRHELNVRVLEPCRRRNDFWWMGLSVKWVNNWNPWICSNWLTANLLVEQDPARRASVTAKILRCLDRFIASYPSDGGCDEGPSYWSRAGASLLDCLETLHAATRGAMDFYDEPLVREMARYIQRMNIDRNWFVNFADAGARLTPPEALVFRFAQRIGDKSMQAWARQLVPASGIPHQLANSGGLARALQALFCVNDLRRTRPTAPRRDDVWLPGIQVVVARPAPSSPHGFTLAAKGGHNGESHNHNDVGNFVVYQTGRPVLVDAGVGTYTRQTFSSQRYKIWTMQSQYHNLPTLNGIMQSDGGKYAARAVRYHTDANESVFELDLAGAYPPAAGVRQWKRRIVFGQQTGILIEEAYQADKPVRQLVLNLMTPCKVVLTKGRLQLLPRPLPAGLQTGRATLSYDAARFKVTLETIRLTDASLENVWGTHLNRIQLQVIAPKRVDKLSLRLTG